MPSRVTSLGERLLPGRIREQRAVERAAVRDAAADLRRDERIAERRRELLASDYTVRTVTVDGHTFYGRQVRAFTAAGASAHNLNLVTDALDRAGIDYFLVPGRTLTRHCVGVRRTDRKDLLATLRSMYGASPLYALKPGGDRMPADATLYADGSLPTALKRGSVIRFGEILLGPDGQMLSDLGYGCDVEFWRPGQALLDDEESGPEQIKALRHQAPPDVLAEALVGPRPNPVTDVLPTKTLTASVRTVQGRAHPTYEDLFRPRVETTDMPLDVVYTWVDGDDPELAARRESFRNSGGAPRIHGRESGASRYASHDELKYSLRSLETFAPFVRNIYVVTDGQTPPWLNTDAPGIQIVDHKDIFSDASALPVFNSHAIGTQLHHIEGLSERYLYFNDDVFLGRPATPDHFFHANGIAKLPFSPSQLGLGAPHPDEPAPNSAGKNVRELLLGTHGRFTTNKFMHTPHPQLRSVMRELEERFAEDIARTSRSRFRSVHDIAMGASLHHHYAYLTGRAVPGKYKLRYIDIARHDAEERLVDLATTRRFDFFCLNDVNTPEEEKESVTARLHAFLESYFPFPSRYER
ncbi:stealth family protein [Streptomyces sp. NPDC091292]|uniref:stealth family protein n=1 Tax=Streptomyces sp. NPDC091292 TaxID=3365991 RepID=UPI003800B495